MGGLYRGYRQPEVRPIKPKTVPDISIGQGRAKHWKKTKLSEQYGEPSKYDHNYPGYFPQAAREYLAGLYSRAKPRAGSFS
jgi:hypothetical protein